LFHYRYMQTDPNPANFFYDSDKKVLNLIDFGAAREYLRDFVKEYMDVVYGASIRDRNMVYNDSKALGFLTGGIYKFMPLMLKNRLSPPPAEVYSLHRMLSGTYLMCMKLNAKVNVGWSTV